MTRMALAVALAVAHALALASCLESETISCDFGVICPKGLRCEPIGKTCVRPGEAVCGNGQREGAEQCDDGPDNSDEVRDACRRDCTLAHCGDRVIDSGEVCDVGADLSAAGCSPDCRSTEVCGNAYVDQGRGERCDDGNLRDGDGCDAYCQPELLGWWEPAVVPAPASKGAMAYDARRGVMVSFSDYVGPSLEFGGAVDSRVFELDGVQWGAVVAANANPNLADVAVAYDPGREAVVVVGSSDTGCETWTYDGLRWSPVASLAPSVCAGAALTFDGNLGALLLVAGSGAWRLDEDGWHPIGANLPFGDRRDAALVFDPSILRTVLFGGVDADDATWLFDGGDWTRAEPATRPAPRRGAAMVWDAARQRLVMFGGQVASQDSVAETWVFAAGDWSQLDVGPSVGRRHDFGMAYDAARGTTLVVGGVCSTVGEPGSAGPGDCESRPFELGERWTPALDVMGPRPRRASAATFATSLGATVVFGGVALDDGGGDDGLLGDTWVGGGSTWQLWRRLDDPPPRRDAQLAFDSRRARLVLFGGAGAGDAPLADTWELGPDGWVRGPDGGGPSPRYGHAMAFDRQRGVVVLYGGRDASRVLGDRWEYDGRAWTEVESAAPPGPRFDAAMAYDAARRVLVIYGGRTTVNALVPADRATWELGDTWSKRPFVFDSTKSRHQMVFDEARARLVMVQTGDDVLGSLPDSFCDILDCFTLAVREPGPFGWMARSPLGQAPRSAVRDLSHVVYDAVRARIMLAARAGWVLA
ncbi:MAG: DUF4215 domain-containing protein [Myxococcota bacterium]